MTLTARKAKTFRAVGTDPHLQVEIERIEKRAQPDRLNYVDPFDSGECAVYFDGEFLGWVRSHRAQHHHPIDGTRPAAPGAVWSMTDADAGPTGIRNTEA